MPIVRDDGFHADDLNVAFAPSDCANAPAVDLAPDVSDADLAPLLDRLDEVQAIRVAFPSSSDGRGFTIAGILRRAGFTGRLRAAGHVLADQYAMARRSGFDEVEIDDALAARQPQGQWKARADWKTHSYQARLRA